MIKALRWRAVEEALMGQLVINFEVQGDPAPQGSKDAMPIYRGSKAKGTREFTGRVALVEASKAVKPWRAAVEEAARKAQSLAGGPWTPVRGPVRVCVQFTVPRPARVPSERRGMPSVFPDLDKLVRSTMDALTSAAVWADDGQVIGFTDMEDAKRYVGAPGALDAPGAKIWVWEA